jgi:hypothetical protein
MQKTTRRDDAAPARSFLRCLWFIPVDRFAARWTSFARATIKDETQPTLDGSVVKSKLP